MDGGVQIGLIVTAAGFGFRHGIDWDHIAALSDITGSQDSRRQSMTYASLYAAGHALVVFALGIAAIAFAAQLPNSVDGIMQRFVGVTLLALGSYVAVSLLRHGRHFRMRSRWMLLIGWTRRATAALREWRADDRIVIDHDHPHGHGNHDTHVHDHVPEVAVVERLSRGSVAVATRHRHQHRHVATMPADPFTNYVPRTAFGIGMLHGVGAETPTQVLVFATAAGATGKFAGVAILVSFVVGLLVSNSVVAAAATLGFVGAQRNFAVYATVSALTALFSLVVGALFVLGRGAVLPAMFGG